MIVGLGGCIYVSLTVERFLSVLNNNCGLRIDEGGYGGNDRRGGHPSSHLLHVLLKLTDYHISFLDFPIFPVFVVLLQSDSKYSTVPVLYL